MENEASIRNLTDEELVRYALALPAGEPVSWMLAAELAQRLDTALRIAEESDW